MDGVIVLESRKNSDQNGSLGVLISVHLSDRCLRDRWFCSVRRLNIRTRKADCTVAIGVWSGQMLDLEYEFAVGPSLRCVSMGTGGTKIVVESVDTH
jgi:hypothetical protein